MVTQPLCMPSCVAHAQRMPRVPTHAGIGPSACLAYARCIPGACLPHARTCTCTPRNAAQRAHGGDGGVGGAEEGRETADGEVPAVLHARWIGYLVTALHRALCVLVCVRVATMRLPQSRETHVRGTPYTAGYTVHCTGSYIVDGGPGRRLAQGRPPRCCSCAARQGRTSPSLAQRDPPAIEQTRRCGRRHGGMPVPAGVTWFHIEAAAIRSTGSGKMRSCVTASESGACIATRRAHTAASLNIPQLDLSTAVQGSWGGMRRVCLWPSRNPTPGKVCSHYVP